MPSFSKLNGYDVKDKTARSNISQMETEIAIERSRIDQLASLPEGSTTGDAELQDIRVGFDGYQYDTAGNSVRGQARILNDSIMRLNDLSFDIENNKAPTDWFEKGNLENGIETDYRNKSRARSVNILRFSGLTGIRMKTGQMIISYYDDEGNFTSATNWIINNAFYVINRNMNFKLLLTLDRSASATRDDTLEAILDDLEFTVDDGTKPISFNDIYFEHGNLTDGADTEYRQNARIRNKGIIQLPFSTEISVTEGLYYLHYFNDDGTFAYSTGWHTTEKITMPAFQKFRILFTLSLEGNAYQPLKDIINKIIFTPVNSNYTFGNNPNIIFSCRTLEGIPPESKWSVKGAVNNQYDRVRFTVRKTVDGYYFNCHDTNINRYVVNPDGTELSEDVPANDKTLAQLNEYDWGLKYGEKYRGATVPLLEETLKYSAIYNLGVTYHSATSLVDNAEDVANILKLFDKYGLTDNMIVIVSNAQYKPIMLNFKEHNPRISFFVGGTYEYISDNMELIKGLQTSYNKVYTQEFPWGTQPSERFIELVKANNLVLYDTTAMSTEEFLNENKFNKGFNYMEVDKTTMIKDKLRAWGNNLID